MNRNEPRAHFMIAIIFNQLYFQIRNANLKTAPTQRNQYNLQKSLTAKISALRVPRNIRTRGVAIAEHDPVVEKTVRIAGVLREICEELNNFKGKFRKK